MTEPEFYTISRSGVLFDSGGIQLKDSQGGTHTYFGVSYDMLQQAIQNGNANKSQTLSCVHSWEDWGLIWTNVTIGAPEVETYQTNVPGRHGVLDYSEALTGKPVFHNRTAELTFLKFGKMNEWHEDYSTILERLHGQVVQWILDTYPGYYLTGRCTGVSVREDGVHNSVTLTLDAEPFWYGLNDTASDWLWDPFNFETGVIRDYRGAEAIYGGYTTGYQIVGGAAVVYASLDVTYLNETTTATNCGGTLRVQYGTETLDLVVPALTSTQISSKNYTVTLENAIRILPGTNAISFQYTSNATNESLKNDAKVQVDVRFREVRL